MDIKLVAFDLDGTLLNDKKELLQSSIEAILKVQEKGIKTAVCTGRIYVDAAWIGGKISPEMYIIGCNGACVSRADSSRLLYAYAIPDSVLRTITDCCIRHDTMPVFYTQDTEYTGAACEAYMDSKGIPLSYRKKAPGKKHVDVENVEEFYTLIEKYSGKIYKALCYDVDEEKKEAVRREITDSGICSVTGSAIYDSYNLEMMRPGVDKGRTLTAFARTLHIKPEEIMVFGDSENDIPMFEAAGYGIAMGNCTGDIRRRAYAVTKSNEEDGIAWALEKYLL